MSFVWPAGTCQSFVAAFFIVAQKSLQHKHNQVHENSTKVIPLQKLARKNEPFQPMRYHSALICLIAFSCAGQIARAQESLEVKLNASISPQETPLNRAATCVVQLTWRGALSQIEFDPPDTPRLSNFKLAGSASSNWVGLENGVETAIKTFEYTLKPEGLGMGYVEPLRVSYFDKRTNEKHDLHTTRLSVKITDAVPEPGETPLGLIFGIVAGLAVVGGLAYYYWQARKQKAARTRQAAQIVKPVEEEFLEELQASIDLNALDAKEAFTALSKLLRNYLQKRFDIPAQGITSAEVVEAFRPLTTDLNQVMQLEEVLQTSDVVKFSSAGGDPSRLARAYALTENFLRANRKPVEAAVITVK